MAICELFGGMFSFIGEAVAEEAVSIGVKRIIALLKKDPNNEPLVQFIEKVDECLQSASKETGVSLKDLQEKKWRVDWIRKAFDWRNQPPEPVRYLPHFGPIERLRQELESDLLLHGASREECDKFFYNFHKCLGRLTREAGFKAIFEDLQEYDLEDKLLQHLDKTARIREFRMNDADPPLFETFIEPRGVLLEADDWESHCKLPNYLETTAESQLTEYFNKELYCMDYCKHPFLFIGADFGIGKSSFVRMQAANMARDFLRRREGYVPVFFPLRVCAGEPRRISDHLSASGFLSKDGPPLCVFLDALDESGPVNPDHVRRILNHVETLEKNLPANSQFIITSRLILGSKGPVADYVREVLNGKYLRILGFNPVQIKKWFERLSKNPECSWAKNHDLAKLKGIGLTNEEYSKPLYLWMISALTRQGDIDPDSMTAPMGRTGLYLLFMNFVSRSAKAVKSVCTNDPASDKNTDKDKEVKARHILQQLAAMRNLASGNDGLSDAAVKKCLDENQKRFYRDLGGEEFLALSYFGHKRDHFEFIHLSFKEFLLAEYLLGVFLQAAAMGEALNYKIRLCVDEISEEVADFLANLIEGLAALDDEGSGKLEALMTPFLNAVALNCRPLEQMVDKKNWDQRRKSLLLDTMDAAKRMFEDDRPIFLVSDNNEIKPKPMLERYTAYTLPYLHTKYPIYQERWLALMVARALYMKREGKPFLQCYGERGSSLLRDIIMETPELPLWARRLLEAANLRGVDLRGADLSRADLSGANLRRANFHAAIMGDEQKNYARKAGAFNVPD